MGDGELPRYGYGNQKGPNGWGDMPGREESHLDQAAGRHISSSLRIWACRVRRCPHRPGHVQARHRKGEEGLRSIDFVRRGCGGIWGRSIAASGGYWINL